MPASPKEPRIPSYRRHKASGQAVVTLNGQDIYLGAYDSAASRQAYDRAIAEWMAGGRRPPADQGLTVVELVAAYWKHAQKRYGPSHLAVIKSGLSTLVRLYGMTPAGRFGPLALRSVRDAMAAETREDGGRRFCRNIVNRGVILIRQMFKWSVAQELVKPDIWHGLQAVVGLRRGSGEARETAPVRPVADAVVDAIQHHVSRQVWAMVELQRLTGMRPDEVTGMTTGAIDMSEASVWVYTPSHHKTQHWEHVREIAIGPKGQAVLREWLRPDLNEFLFQPREADVERREALTAGRKTPLSCGNKRGSNRRRRPKRKPGERYTTNSYRLAIHRGCDKAGVPRWNPHQLRHSHATAIRSRFGIEVARTMLGHSTLTAAQVYAEADRARAREVAAIIG